MKMGKIRCEDQLMSIRRKDFYSLEATHKLFDEKFVKCLGHEIDGLIFQPSDLVNSLFSDCLIECTTFTALLSWTEAYPAAPNDQFPEPSALLLLVLLAYSIPDRVILGLILTLYAYNYVLRVNLMKLEWIVLQAPIVRLVIVFGQVIAVAEQRENALKLLHLFDLASSASLLLAIFGIHTLTRVTSEQLSQYGFSGIFRIVDVALLFYSAQQPILFQNILLRFGVIHCGPLLSPQDNARFICNFVIIVQFFLLSLFSSFLVSPRRNNLFDLYRDKAQHGSTPTMLSSCPSEDGECPAIGATDITPMSTLLPSDGH